MSKQIQSLELFSCQTERKLKNTFSANAPDLSNENRYDLLRICTVGTLRMISYIRPYILTPPTEIPQKRLRRKLKSFSKSKVTIRSQKSKLARLTKITRGLTKQVHKSGQYLDRVMEFPLAICDGNGDMRPRNKSAFKEAFLTIPEFANIFQTGNPLQMGRYGTEVIVDLLKFIHSPPPPDLKLQILLIMCGPL